MTFWRVEEYKIWKGINPDAPCWNSLGIVTNSYEEAKELMDYLFHNNDDLILRVAKYPTGDE